MPRKTLAVLVKSLDRNERRYFRLEASKQEGEKAYLRLFDQVEAKPEGEEEEWLKAVYPEKPPTQGLTLLKRYLQERILAALRQYHEGKSPAMVIQQQLCDIEILFRKGLFLQASRLLNRARRLAEEAEKTGLLLQLLDWERRLRPTLDEPPRTVGEITEQEGKVLADFQQLQGLQGLFDRAQAYKRKYGYLRGTLIPEFEHEVMESPLLAERNYPGFEQGRYYYLYTKLLYHYMLSQNEQTYSLTTALTGLNPTLLEAPERQDALLEHSTSCVVLGRFDEVLEALAQAKALQATQPALNLPHLRYRLFYYASNYELMAYMYQGNLDLTRAKLKEVSEGLEQMGETLRTEMRLVIRGQMAMSSFLLGDLRACNRYLQAYAQLDRSKIRTDLFEFYSLWRLVLFWEQKEMEALDHHRAWMYRYFKQQQAETGGCETELEIARAFRDLKDGTDPGEIRRMAESIRSVVRETAAQQGNVEFFEGFYPFVIWAEGVLGGIGYAGAARAWWQRQGLRG